MKDPRFAFLCLLAVTVGCADSRTNVSSSPPSGQEQVEVARAESPAEESASAAGEASAEDADVIPRDKLPKTDEEWQARLSPLQFEVTRQKGTERAFRNTYWDNHADGVYRCVCCGTPLFDSTTKYESGTGWPSFWQPVSKSAVREEEDNTLFSTRTEVLCSHCDAHLGHVFEDGPIDRTGLRYCMNSAALNFVPRKKVAADEPAQDATPGDAAADETSGDSSAPAATE